MAQVITDIMHRRPQLDLGHDHFVQAYRAEMACLQSHHNLIRAVLDCQVGVLRRGEIKFTIVVTIRTLFEKQMPHLTI